MQFVIDFVNTTFRMGYCDSSYMTEHKFTGVLPGDIVPLKNSMFAKVYDLHHMSWLWVKY